jgi:DNA gyrase/topoisomerase IV subunit B
VAEPDQDYLVDKESDRVRDYTAASIKVMSFEDSVRRRPQMYFGCSGEDPALVDAVVRAVVSDALYEPSVERVHVIVVIESDLRFSVSDDGSAIALGADGVPQIGFFDSLIDRRRWPIAPVAAMSLRTRVEVNIAGRAWRQELIATSVVGPLETTPTDRAGTRVTLELDPDHFAAHAVLARDPGAYLPAENDQTPPEAGTIAVADLRP